MRHHHKFAGAVYGLTLLVAAGLGSLYALVEHRSEGIGIYWAVQTVTTVGYGDVAPKTNFGHYVAAFAMLVGVAFWTSSFAFVTSFLVSFGIEDAKMTVTKSAEETRQHVTDTVGGETVG